MVFNEDLIMHKLLFVHKKQVNYDEIDISYSKTDDKLKALPPNNESFIIGNLFDVVGTMT